MQKLQLYNRTPCENLRRPDEGHTIFGCLLRNSTHCLYMVGSAVALAKSRLVHSLVTVELFIMHLVRVLVKNVFKCDNKLVGLKLYKLVISLLLNKRIVSEFLWGILPPQKQLPNNIGKANSRLISDVIRSSQRYLLFFICLKAIPIVVAFRQ